MDLSISDIRLKLSPALISRVMEIVDEVVNDPKIKSDASKLKQTKSEQLQQKLPPPEKPWLPKKVNIILFTLEYLLISI